MLTDSQGRSEYREEKKQENPCRWRNSHTGQNLVFKPEHSCKDGVIGTTEARKERRLKAKEALYISISSIIIAAEIQNWDDQ